MTDFQQPAYDIPRELMDDYVITPAPIESTPIPAPNPFPGLILPSTTAPLPSYPVEDIPAELMDGFEPAYTQPPYAMPTYGPCALGC